MAHEITPQLRALMVGGKHCWCTLWIIERTDGVILRFTDHDQTLTLDGEEFTPSGSSVSATARQHIEGVEPQNLDIRGAVTSDSISNDDLRAGLYRQAKVTELLVDWRYPWAGTFVQNVYYIEETTFSDTAWVARLAGLSVRLRPNVGRKVTRSCSFVFGDSATCGFDVSTVTVTGRTVSSIVTDGREFGSDVTGADGLYDKGVMRWTTGDNAGLKGFVKSFLNPGGLINLQLKTVFPIQVGDTFSIERSCDKLDTTCKAYGNFLRFGGFPSIPGNDRLIEVPGT